MNFVPIETGLLFWMVFGFYLWIAGGILALITMLYKCGLPGSLLGYIRTFFSSWVTVIVFWNISRKEIQEMKEEFYLEDE